MTNGRIKELAEEAAACIFTNQLDEEETAKYLNGFFGDVIKEIFRTRGALGQIAEVSKAKPKAKRRR